MYVSLAWQHNIKQYQKEPGKECLSFYGCYSFQPSLVPISEKKRRIVQCDLCAQVLQLWVHVTSLYEINVFLQLSVRREKKKEV